MKFSIAKEELLRPLNRVIGAVERKNTLPILGTILFRLQNGNLELTATDAEIELKDSVEVQSSIDFEWTLPARKLFDILRSLPDQSIVNFSLSETKATITSSKSRFTLAMLPASDYPATAASVEGIRFDLLQADFKRLLSNVELSMAQHDVRYYLNGLLLELEGEQLVAVSTDGHRLSLSSHQLSTPFSELKQVIIPNKAVRELIRLLDNPDASISITVSDSQFNMRTGSLAFSSKVIEGKYPDYRRVIPPEPDYKAVIDRQELLAALARVQILSNDKFNGVGLKFKGDELTIEAQNPEQEEAEDSVRIEYNGQTVEIGFNIRYIIDILKVINTDHIEFLLSNSSASALVSPLDDSSLKFVVMPIRL